MNSIYNLKYELALRILILLSLTDEPKTIDTISALDLIITYGSSFNLTDHNLHGENPYFLSELSSRRNIISEAITYLVRNSLVKLVSSTNGLSYKINQNGLSVISSTTSTYSHEYKKSAEIVLSATKGFSDTKIIGMILNHKRK